jgi:hypothetical protein
LIALVLTLTAYEFSKKFPGYTSEVRLQPPPPGTTEARYLSPLLTCHVLPVRRFCLQNLSERGVHEVSQRRFVLVAAVSIAIDHVPLPPTHHQPLAYICVFCLFTGPPDRLCDLRKC